MTWGIDQIIVDLEALAVFTGQAQTTEIPWLVCVVRCCDSGHYSATGCV